MCESGIVMVLSKIQEQCGQAAPNYCCSEKVQWRPLLVKGNHCYLHLLCHKSTHVTSQMHIFMVTTYWYLYSFKQSSLNTVINLLIYFLYFL